MSNLDFEDIRPYRIPFYLAPDESGTYEFGLPGDEHYEMPERRWFHQKWPHVDEGEMQGFVSFHPEFNKSGWPVNLDTGEEKPIDPALKQKIEDHAKAIWDAHEPWHPIQTSKTSADEWTNHIARMEKLGASVEELAKETVESILGYQGKGGHKPARPDIQKYKDIYDSFREYRKSQSSGEIGTGEGYNKAVSDWWSEHYGLNEKEQSAVALYKHVLIQGDMRGDPQKAFDFVAKIWSGMLKPQSRSGDELMDGLNTVADGLIPESQLPTEATPEAKKFVGGALKKYEAQNWPILYDLIKSYLDDMLRTGPAESYKLWPRGVVWIKEMFTNWLWYKIDTFNRQNMSITAFIPELQHIEDITREGGKILDTLRRENKLPQGFDANKVDFKEFETWLMEWKRENLGSEHAGEIVYEYKDGWTMQKLTTPEQLQYEGDEMGHCVGGYSGPVGNGEDIIYSLRDPKGEPHVTIEVRALEGPPNLSEDGNVPEDAAFNHEYIHPDKHSPGEHLEERHDHSNLTEYHPSGETPFEVVQVQGNSNKTPKPEYQHKVKEFFDSLRSKGWKLIRSDDWFAPFDDDDDEEWGTAVKDAHSLTDWYDDGYRSEPEAFTGMREDAYGLGNIERRRIGIDRWEEVFAECAASLIDDYDRDRMKTSNYAWLAQATWHAYMVDLYHTKMTKEMRENESRNFEIALENSEEKVQEWVFENQEYAHETNEFANEVEAMYEKMGGQWKDEDYDPKNENNWHDPYGNPFREPANEELLEEARQEVLNEYDDAYAGNAFKYFGYLYNLLHQVGIQVPSELPNPNDRHGGLPSYEDLTHQNQMTIDQQTQQSQDIPGALG